ncbi:MAG: hypothetical protein M3N34_03645 [Pseudomonadota bacterium]|nr:hypothetical protein [Pseudomonadota bacterium]
MSSRQDLQSWIIESLQLNGASTVTEVAKIIWHDHEADLRKSGDLFYTWQYDMRWQAQKLQDQGKLVKRKSDRLWALP